MSNKFDADPEPAIEPSPRAAARKTSFTLVSSMKHIPIMQPPAPASPTPFAARRTVRVGTWRLIAQSATIEVGMLMASGAACGKSDCTHRHSDTNISISWSTQKACESKVVLYLEEHTRAHARAHTHELTHTPAALRSKPRSRRYEGSSVIRV